MPFGIQTESQQCFFYRPEQDIKKHLFVYQNQRIELMWYGKDIVKISHRQEFGLAGFQPPCFGQGLALAAMTVAARVVLIVLMITLITLSEVTSQLGGATMLNFPHYPVCGQGKRVIFAIFFAKQRLVGP
jgi:hypothetical protein